jgi:hypothetical protein
MKLTTDGIQILHCQSGFVVLLGVMDVFHSFQLWLMQRFVLWMSRTLLYEQSMPQHALAAVQQMTD